MIDADKLIAAETGNEKLLVQILESLRSCKEELIADGMTMEVVNRLELIKIYQKHEKRRASGDRGSELCE